MGDDPLVLGKYDTEEGQQRVKSRQSLFYGIELGKVERRFVFKDYWN